MASMGAGETEGRIATECGGTSKKNHLRHRCQGNFLASNNANIDWREPEHQLVAKYNHQLGPISSHHYHHHDQGDNLRMALAERGEVRARTANSGTHRVGGGLACDENQRSSDELRQTSRRCVNINENRHRRRASRAGGNLLTRSLVANQMILMTSLSFLLLLVLSMQQQPQHVAALKLPSFLASWIPQQQQQQQQVSATGQLQDLVTAADLSGDHSSNLLLFAPNGQDNTGLTPKLVKQQSSPLKRPFSGIVGKHPFSALPKGLFGRILSSGGHAGSSNSQQQSVRQQVGAGAILSPMTRHQQQQLVLAMMANSQKFHQASSGQQPPPPTVGYWPFGAPVGASSGGNYSQQASMQPHGNFISANNQQHQHFGQQQRPITSFRPTAQQAHQNVGAGGQSEPPKKHALGYGESDEDFVIVNAEQVPDLQRPHNVVQQQQRPLAAVPTRHPSEEYREMPAIVIADPDDETVASLGLPVAAANQTVNATTSGDQAPAELVKLQPMASQSNTTTVATGVNQTVPSDVTPAPQVDSGANATISRQPLVAADSDHTVAGPSFESQHQNSSIAADTPETNRQESVASAVIVAASNDAAALAHQEARQPEPEALESFVLGPYKGLSLSDDELATNPSSHQFQTQMESFIDHQQPAPPQFSFPAYHMQQPPQLHQQMRHQNIQQQQQHPRFGQNGPQNLLGSASNLLQQARQLIQLPFTHLPHNTHLHQQHMPAQHQQQQHRRPQLMHRPQQQQPHWPTPMFGMPQRPQQQVNFYPNFQQQQQQQVSSSSMRNPQVHQQNPAGSYNFSPNNQRPPAYLFQEGQNFHSQARPSSQNGANFNLLVNHNNQMAQQPSSAYFVDHSAHPQQQQHQLPAMVPPVQHGQDSYRQAAVFANSNETTSRQPPHFAQQMTQINSKHKSGLYQIEPPKLESGDKIVQQQQQQLVDSSDDDSTLQQQQKIDVQENASDEELGGGGADEDDEQQQPIEQQQQENEQKGEQQHQTQQMIAVVEPADQQQANAANFSQQSHHQMAPPPNQILQVGASFGVAPNFTAPAASANQSQQVAVINEGRRGLVFNESLESQQPQQQVADHDITTAYEFRQQEQAAPEQQQQQVTNYLDTQVYTLPYTMAMQNQVASFVPQQQQPAPSRYFAPQRAASHQQQWQQQQMPVTFIRTTGWENQNQQQSLPVPEPPSWANSKQPQQQFFHHYQPVDQTSNVVAASAFAPAAQQASPRQFAFAVQHQPSQLLVQRQQQQVLESAAPSGEQQQQQQDAVNAASNSDQLASSSTTTPSSRADDPGFGPADISGSLASQQGQQQQDQEPDRKSQQPPSQSGGGQQTKQVAPRSPSSFCAGRASGLYADVEQRCKAYYQCAPTGHQMFQCNNQTQFNQKTQNCDWWYNVDCGGRLGSPEDFEQASPSSPRSQLVSMDQESATPTAASATPPSFSSPAQASFETNNQQQQPTQAADLRSFVEPPPSSTLAYNTPPPAQATTTTQTQVPNATTQPSQQQLQFEAQATTTSTTSTGDDRTLSSLQQFSERSSSAPAQSASASAGSRISNEQQQQRQSDEGNQQSAAQTTTTASSNQLIEVVNSGQTDDGTTQPRVGASPNDDTPTSTPQATPTSTPQQTTMTTTSVPAPGDAGQTTEGQATQNEVTSQREQQPEVRGQIQQATSGKPSARRFIQSEFGGSTKTARAISHQRKFKQQQQQQVASTGDLLAVDAALPRISPLQDEMSQLHAQLEEHHSVRLGSAADVGSSQTSQGAQPESQPQQQQIYSTSANQGSVSYDPQAGVREQQTIDLLGQFAPTARTGFASSRAAGESSQQQSQEQSAAISQPVDETQKPTTRTLERRFGARLPAAPKRI